MPQEPEVIERHEEGGRSWELLRRGEAYEVRVDGVTLCATDQPRNESSFVELGLAPLRTRDDVTVLVAGLGVGRTLRAVLDQPFVKRVDVVEASPHMVDWAKRFFAASNGDALADSRVRLHQEELGALLKRVRLGAPGVLPEEGVFALLLDLDKGPSSPSRPGNEAFYTDDGLERLEMALRPGGVLSLWSPSREPELTARLSSRFVNVAEVVVPVDLPDGTMNLDYVYRARRQAAERAAAGPAN
jgi:spermidine synthase